MSVKYILLFRPEKHNLDPSLHQEGGSVVLAGGRRCLYGLKRKVDLGAKIFGARSVTTIGDSIESGQKLYFKERSESTMGCGKCTLGALRRKIKRREIVSKFLYTVCFRTTMYIMNWRLYEDYIQRVLLPYWGLLLNCYYWAWYSGYYLWSRGGEEYSEEGRGIINKSQMYKKPTNTIKMASLAI